MLRNALVLPGTDEGAQALALLKEAPALVALDLNLGHNVIGDGGAEALAGLREAPALHALALNLNFNHIRGFASS
jgi:hypothetical protein